MKKLLFVGFMVLGFSEISENAWGMNDPFRTESMSGSSPVTQAELAERERIIQIQNEDMRRQADTVNSQISTLTSQVSGLAQLIQSLSAQVSALTNQNESLRSERDTLSHQLAEFKDSAEQRKLEAIEQANALKQKELEQIKAAEAARSAHNNSIQQQITKLERERDEWAQYLDGRKTVYRKYIGSGANCHLQNAWEINQFEQNEKSAPQKIAAIDQQMANLRAQFK